jgi:uncharacterized protein (DUF488 family)
MLDITRGDRIELMTIGYEGASISDFIATLKLADVRTLIDVRELPLSRKRGFSKNALHTALTGVAINFLHLKSLGDPKPGRDAARAGDMDTFRRIFESHLQSRQGRDGIEEAISVVIEGGACLLCFERCHTECHRSIVAEEIARQTRISLRHIGVQHGLGKQHSS